MAKLTLHKAIALILAENASRGLTIAEIVRKIRTGDLYRGADGRPPSSVQISARVHNYPRMFTIDRRTRPHTVRLREDMQRANSGDDGGASGRPGPRPDEVAGSVVQVW